MDTNQNWLTNLLGGLQQASTVASSWKELVAPVKAVQTPVMSMGGNSPSITTSATKGQAKLNNQTILGVSNATALWIAGGLGVLLVTLIVKRK